ncbi:MAG: hypothetical protein PHI63_05085 [Patescibacteria group bacterium]|nr:hypothetical protein [Patescibacteria group bacterium]
MAGSDTVCPECGTTMEYTWIGVGEHHMWVCPKCGRRLEPPSVPPDTAPNIPDPKNPWGIIIFCAVVVLIILFLKGFSCVQHS